MCISMWFILNFILFYFILFYFYFILFLFYFMLCYFFIIIIIFHLYLYLYFFLFFFIFFFLLTITKLKSNRFITWKYTLSWLQSQKSLMLYLSCSNYRTLYCNFSGTNELLAFFSLDRLFVRCTDSAAVLKTFFTT